MGILKTITKALGSSTIKTSGNKGSSSAKIKLGKSVGLPISPYSTALIEWNNKKK